MLAAIYSWPLFGSPLWRCRLGRTIHGAEEYGLGCVDVAVVPRPYIVRRTYGVYRMAEYSELLPVIFEGQGG